MIQEKMKGSVISKIQYGLETKPDDIEGIRKDAYNWYERYFTTFGRKLTPEEQQEVKEFIEQELQQYKK